MVLPSDSDSTRAQIALGGSLTYLSNDPLPSRTGPDFHTSWKPFDTGGYQRSREVEKSTNDPNFNEKKSIKIYFGKKYLKKNFR